MPTQLVQVPAASRPPFLSEVGWTARAATVPFMPTPEPLAIWRAEGMVGMVRTGPSALREASKYAIVLVAPAMKWVPGARGQMRDEGLM